jgi:zinc/manganese transport system substrate-binding protein
MSSSKFLRSVASSVSMPPRAREARIGFKATRLRVVATLPDYAYLAEILGGERVLASHLIQGNKDVCFTRPKFGVAWRLLRKADLLIATGLDFEPWLSGLVEKWGSPRLRNGEAGYIVVSDGMQVLEASCAHKRFGDIVHTSGNPHVTCSPVQMRVAAKNIVAGLIRNDPEGEWYYRENLSKLLDELDRRLFGAKLVRLVGGETLCGLAQNGNLIRFLEDNAVNAHPLINDLGGWMARMLPLRNLPVVTYHKTWTYFLKLFGLEEADTVEPALGIPPTADAIFVTAARMRRRNVKIILAANYFWADRIIPVAAWSNAEPVIVPLYVGGERGIGDYFALVDVWIQRLVDAADRQGLLNIRHEPEPISGFADVATGRVQDEAAVAYAGR